MNRSVQDACAEWENLAKVDPRSFPTAKRFGRNRSVLFLVVSRSEKSRQRAASVDEILTYAGSGIIKVTEVKTNIPFVYVAPNGDSYGADWMWGSATVNIEKLINGKIKFAFENLVAEEIRNQLTFVAPEKAQPMIRLLEKWQKKNGIVKSVAKSASED